VILTRLQLTAAFLHQLQFFMALVVASIHPYVFVKINSLVALVVQLAVRNLAQIPPVAACNVAFATVVVLTVPSALHFTVATIVVILFVIVVSAAIHMPKQPLAALIFSMQLHLYRR